ncbi:uncharacterized protein LOC106661900 [Cimex lectularius]|uniref:Uncharacterized protein n=1 Tax=Cimex lectularius TaxID=79782 RepID=A0A8I6R9L2_CIMLE|nr:uncharacterized protein LOC106661900 [Cimex lectularius]
MSLASGLLLALLALALQGIGAEDRRSDVRAVLGAETEPGFWPTRGRRGGSSEEQPPPFWAHRGRDIQIPCSSSPVPSRLYAQEPKYLLIQRRDVLDQPLWVRGKKWPQE